MAKIVVIKKNDPARRRFVVDYYDVDGRRRKERYRKERDANVRLGEVIAQRETGELRPRNTDRTLAALADDWRLSPQWSKLRDNSRSVYAWLLDTWILGTHKLSPTETLALGRRKLRTITLRDCEQLHRHVQEQTAKSSRAKTGRSTANMALGVLKQLLTYAEKHRYIASNPARHVKPHSASFEERRRKVEGDVLTADELRALFEKAEGEWRPLLMLAALTGLRRGEVLGLQWGDVDWQRSRVHVRRQLNNGKLADPKTPNALRSVPLAPELVRELKPWKLKCPKGELDLVFPNPEGGPMSTQTLDAALARTLRRAGLRRITMHALRHTFASTLISSGVSIKTAQRLLGHANIQMTLQTYAHMLPGDDDGVAAALSSRVFGNAARATGT